MNTHNIGFYDDLKKLSLNYHQISSDMHLISSAATRSSFVLQKYLQDLHNLHEDWLIKKSPFQPPAPVLVLDADKDLPAMYEVFEQEKSKILFNIATNSVT